MKQFLTPNDLANQVRLTRTQHKGTIIIPEGSTDSRVLSRYIDQKSARLIAANGKDNSLLTLNILESSNVDGIISLVDSDFWKLENYNPNSKNVLCTDTHDFDTMLISSPAFEKLISEFANRHKLVQISNSPRDYLIDLVKPIGFLRWISSPFKENLNLKFKTINYSSFINTIDFTLDEDKLILEVLKITPYCTLSAVDLKNKLKNIKQSFNSDPLQLIGGHDAMHVFDIGLRQNFGNIRGQKGNVDIIEAALRMGYEKEYFEKTELYNSLINWEKRNPRYKVF